MPTQARAIRVPQWLRFLLPDTLDRVPSKRQMEESDDLIAMSIVQQHAEGSVLLSAGQFEITGDLVEEEQ